MSCIPIDNLIIYYLFTTIARQGVVPQALVRAGHWFLVMAMVTVSSYSSCKSCEGCGELQHLAKGTSTSTKI